ncbi:MAG TPA: nucleoside triphosphate pyrophosphohydrolase [Peptococcaceae bacterium]|nr:nucleoside triphosphate pyrophosphohydrolase [Peptococcaceae bacterium]
MKSVLHIVGLGSGSLDKLPLKVYRVLTGADAVYVCSPKHPAVADLEREKIPYFGLCPEVETVGEGGEIGPEEIAQSLLCAELPGKTQNKQREIVLALPGNPLKEGRVVTCLQSALDSSFTVRTDLLADDSSLVRLVEIMRELRSSNGCPWDKEQTHDSLKKYLLEETYEVLEALDTKNMNNLCEELGDLLLQVVFHCQLAEEANIFGIEDVLKGIGDKLIRRHPHVFGSVVVESSTEVLRNWEAIKKNERKAQSGPVPAAREFFKIPKGLPALMLAEDTQRKAAKVGFDWEDYQGPLAKVYEEIAELKQEINNKQKIANEFGDLLFSIVNLSRFLGVNAEEALRQATRKFQERFLAMLSVIESQGLRIEDLSLEEMDLYWDEVKKKEKYGTLDSF